MRLKRLEVFGFKSFFDKTVITFQPGMTAIVGPNGCGKSNLADAILWVLGEQSAKNLRGARMEDVIFNGAEFRKPLGMAEVSLTFGEISGELPPPYSPYSEITMTRRLFRSGESEYLINKTLCRLKDIRDLLIDTGAGYRAHTIIEQGKVEELISASPLQRREIVEEAAGIAKYRIRKAEALRRLEATEQNLTRVRDIIGEIKRQIQSLDRQARKAEKYQKLKEELKSLELQVAGVEWNEWNRRREALEREEGRLRESVGRQEGRLAALDLQQAEIKLSLAQKEQELSQINSQVFETEGGIQRLEGKIETMRVQRREWDETLSRNHQEIGEIRQAESALRDERESLEKERGEIHLRLPEHEQLLANREEEVDHLERALTMEIAELEKGKVALFELASHLTESRNNLLHIEARKQDLQKKRGRGVLEFEEIRSKKETSEEAMRRLQREMEGIKAQFAEKSEAHAAAARLLKEIETALTAQGGRLSRIKEEWGGKSAQVASREGFYRGLLGRQEGTENPLLQLEGLQGMIADLMEVPTPYEKAIEAVLEGRLRGIIVENHTQIKKGIEGLRNFQAGRGTFFTKSPRRFGEKGAPSVQGPGVVGRALDLISYRAGYDDILDLLLGEVILTQDLDSALRLWESSTQATTFVTLQGEVVDPSGIVSGGERGETGLLEHKREIKSLSDRMEGLQAELKSLETEIGQNQATQEETRVQIETRSREIRSLEIDQLNKQKDHAFRLAEIDRLQGALQTVLFEQEEGDKEAVEILTIEQAEQNQMAEGQRLKEEAEAELNRRQERLNASRRSLDLLKGEGIQLKLETASLKEKQRHILDKLQRMERTEEELSLRLQEKERLQSSVEEKLKGSELEEGETVSAIQRSASERERLLERMREKREAHSAIVAGLQQVEGETYQLRSTLDQTQKGSQEKALRKVEAQMTQVKIRETILMNYQIEIATHPLPEAATPVEEARARAISMRDSLDAMGPVNLGAIEEYRELETRYRFLTTQEADLVTSMESLCEAISKINKTTQTLFVDTFQALNQKFQEVFTSFFGGGKAALVLVDEAHPLDSGIEMLAQPPGKKPRSITLLSGGEKALTAISLLFATFLIHPSPFCLLDEIDAPLDEENTRRFTQALTKMSRQTQFIIVTHNKRTMEIADVLYGVTMEEVGISRLISVSLNEPSRSNGAGHSVGTPVTSDSA